MSGRRRTGRRRTGPTGLTGGRSFLLFGGVSRPVPPVARLCVSNPRYRIQFPPAQTEKLGQDEVTFRLIEGGGETVLRFHDYAAIYDRPGLYEQLFYDRLRCCSPAKVGEILSQTLRAAGETASELRVLDLGAGNGMMGEVLKRHGVARLIGTDILPEAQAACFRDRPEVYDEYYVADFTDLPAGTAERIDEWRVDCLTTVAALGFGDIPPAAFARAMKFLRPGGWAAFNIRDTFLDQSDSGGFSRFVRELIQSEYLEVFHLEKYRHRLGMEGTPLFYFALVGRKTGEIPPEFLARFDE